MKASRAPSADMWNVYNRMFRLRYVYVECLTMSEFGERKHLIQ